MSLTWFVSDSDEFQIYFGLPYIPKPHLKSQYAHIFTTEFSKKVLNQMLRFLKTQALTLHDSETVERQQHLFDELQRRLRKGESEIRKLEEDYGNILQLALELMDLLQASVQGHPVNIGNDIIDRLSARLGKDCICENPSIIFSTQSLLSTMVENDSLSDD